MTEFWPMEGTGSQLGAAGRNFLIIGGEKGESTFSLPVVTKWRNQHSHRGGLLDG
jgi:hypothetical protein